MKEIVAQTKIGFVGAGGIAARHVRVLSGFDDVKIVGFADPDFSRAEEMAASVHGRAYRFHDDLLAMEQLNALYICVPPFAHGRPELDAIAIRLPFFVEKPVALDLAVAEAIASEVETSRLVTAVGYHWRYLDTMEEARSLLANNPAELVSGYWLDQTPHSPWWWQHCRSGGQIVEQATHIIDVARCLVGEISHVYGQEAHLARSDFPELDVAAASTASLKFASGAIGTISATCLLRWGHRIGLHIFADGLAIELSDREIMVDVGCGRPIRQAQGDPVLQQDRDFIDAVRGFRNRIRCPYAEAVKTHRVALAIARSAEAGRPISLEPAGAETFDG